MFLYAVVVVYWLSLLFTRVFRTMHYHYIDLQIRVIVVQCSGKTTGCCPPHPKPQRFPSKLWLRDSTRKLVYSTTTESPHSQFSNSNPLLSVLGTLPCPPVQFVQLRAMVANRSRPRCLGGGDGFSKLFSFSWSTVSHNSHLFHNVYRESIYSTLGIVRRYSNNLN